MSCEWCEKPSSIMNHSECSPLYYIPDTESYESVDVGKIRFCGELGYKEEWSIKGINIKYCPNCGQKLEEINEEV